MGKKKEPFEPLTMTKAAFSWEEFQPGYVPPEVSKEKNASKSEC